jgi:hypothetical protein
MSIERRRRLKKKSKGETSQKETKQKKTRGHIVPKKEFTPEEIKARKKAQRIGMFDKKKNLHKKITEGSSQ